MMGKSDAAGKQQSLQQSSTVVYISSLLTSNTLRGENRLKQNMSSSEVPIQQAMKDTVDSSEVLANPHGIGSNTK